MNVTSEIWQSVYILHLGGVIRLSAKKVTYFWTMSVFTSYGVNTEFNLILFSTVGFFTKTCF